MTATAERMLDAASSLFAQRRYHEVRMEDIAQHARVGKGTLYRYFADKEDLFLAIIDRAGRQLMEQVTVAVAQAGSIPAQLEAFACTAIEYFNAHPNLFDLIQRSEVTLGSSTPWHQVRRQIHEMVRRIFEQGRKSGVLVEHDPDLAALMLVGGMRQAWRFGQSPRDPALGKQLVALLLNGLQHQRTA
jgi:TetR/AcrR family fatty acid metabolism transcriptional regulator